MKKWVAWCLILTLLTGLVGCEKPGAEKSAASGEYIEGIEQEMSGDKPQKGDDQVTINDLDPTEKDPEQGNTPGETNPDDTPSEEKEPEQEEEPDEIPDRQDPVTQPEDDTTEETPEETPEDTPETSLPEETLEQTPEETPEEPEEDQEEEPEEDPEEEPEEDPDEEMEEEEPVVRPVVKPVVKPEEPEEDEPSGTNNQLKIVSYNVRYKSDGTGKTISERSKRFKKVMDQYDPDIMGLQEVVPEWLEYLEQDFGGKYGYINQWRAVNSQEGTPIFWKKDKFELVDSGRFWLSDTPDKESKTSSWGAKHYRVCLWVKLKIKATGKVFLFFNTHFDTQASARPKSATLIVERAVKMGGFTTYPVLLTGDFNMNQGTEPYNILYTRFKDANKELNNDQTPTSNGYHENKKGNLIDFCFYSPTKITPLKYQIIDEKVDGGYVSDHCGILVQAQIN